MEAAVAFLGPVAKLGWNVKKRGSVEIPRNFLGIIKGVNRIAC